jgi:hypothetical protein
MKSQRSNRSRRFAAMVIGSLIAAAVGALTAVGGEGQEHSHPGPGGEEYRLRSERPF